MCDTTFHRAIRQTARKTTKNLAWIFALLAAGKALADDEMVELDPNGFCIWQFLHDLWDFLNGLIC